MELVFLEKKMNNEQNKFDLDLEIKNLLKNVEEMRADIDLYSILVEEQVLVGV